MPAWHDRGLMNRIRPFSLVSHEGMSSFVVRGERCGLFGDDRRLSFCPHHYFILRPFQYFHRDGFRASQRSFDGRLVDDIEQVGSAHAWRGSGQCVQINIFPHFGFFAVEIEYLKAPFDVGKWNSNMPVKSAGPNQSRVQTLRKISGCYDNDAGIGNEAVHLYQKLIERLFGVILHFHLPRTSYGIDLIDENNAGTHSLGFLEQIPDPLRAQSDKHFFEF
mmetsp:Transcript_9397/g.14168  ORF Transcript_9397/g.14168 Transcript_9397/m.14168 type:complete len:220 (+) Transcript_9397:609-1268(+)